MEDGARGYERGHQRRAILALLMTGNRYTVEELHALLGGRQTSIATDLRNLRKERFGGYIIHTTGDRFQHPFYYWLGELPAAHEEAAP